MDRGYGDAHHRRVPDSRRLRRPVCDHGLRCPHTRWGGCDQTRRACWADEHAGWGPSALRVDDAQLCARAGDTPLGGIGDRRARSRRATAPLRNSTHAHTETPCPTRGRGEGGSRRSTARRPDAPPASGCVGRAGSLIGEVGLCYTPAWEGFRHGNIGRPGLLPVGVLPTDLSEKLWDQRQQLLLRGWTQASPSTYRQSWLLAVEPLTIAVLETTTTALLGLGLAVLALRRRLWA